MPGAGAGWPAGAVSVRPPAATVSVPPLVPVERPLTVVVAPLTMLTRIVWVSGTWS